MDGNESNWTEGKSLVLYGWGLGIVVIFDSGAGAEGGAQGEEKSVGMGWVGLISRVSSHSEQQEREQVAVADEQTWGFQAQVPARLLCYQMGLSATSTAWQGYRYFPANQGPGMSLISLKAAPLLLLLFHSS